MCLSYNDLTATCMIERKMFVGEFILLAEHAIRATGL